MTEKNTEETEETYIRKINYENNTNISIDKFKELKEFKLRTSFIKWNILGEDNEDKSASKGWWW